MGKLEFNYSAKNIDMTNALRLAEACEKAYESEKKIKAFVRIKWGFEKEPAFFDIGDTQAFIASNEQAIFLVFRGTESIQDWLTDIDVLFVKDVLGNVHSGFSEALDLVWNNILAELVKLIKDVPRPIWVTGHSLGAALAALSAARLAKRRIKINGLYTFGQPRVGDKAFARNFDMRFKPITFRFVNDHDIVTRVPPELLGYEHVGRVCYFDSDGILHKDARWWGRFMKESINTTNTSLERYAELDRHFPNGIEDHGIGNYIARLKANCK